MTAIPGRAAHRRSIGLVACCDRGDEAGYRRLLAELGDDDQAWGEQLVALVFLCCAILRPLPPARRTEFLRWAALELEHDDPGNPDRDLPFIDDLNVDEIARRADPDTRAG